jgi:pyruvate-ferredoxin/flavodoxin oxidoreductase
MSVQGYFVFDAHKGEGLTISHLRFGNEPIKAQYEISNDADYVAIHHISYLHRLAENFMGPIKVGGALLLNVPWTTAEGLDKNLSPKLKRLIAEKQVRLYAIDARAIAAAVGLRQRINNIMQACFYKLSGVLPEEQALEVLRNDIETLYTSKGPKVLKMNYDGVDAALEAVTQVHYPDSWLGAGDQLWS